MRYLFTSAIILFLLGACNKESKSTCDTSNTSFSQLLTDTYTNNHTLRNTLDTEVHAYSFTLDANQEICKIGYRSQPETENTAYTIQIIKTADSAIVYTGTHFFSANAKTYVTPNVPIQLSANTDYTIQRIITAYALITHTIGWVSKSDNMNFPYTELGTANDGITITASYFNDENMQDTFLNNSAIPEIDLVFKQQ